MARPTPYTDPALRRVRKHAIHTADLSAIPRGEAIPHRPAQREMCDLRTLLLRRAYHVDQPGAPALTPTAVCAVARRRRTHHLAWLDSVALNIQRRRSRSRLQEWLSVAAPRQPVDTGKPAGLRQADRFTNEGYRDATAATSFQALSSAAMFSEPSTKRVSVAR